MEQIKIEYPDENSKEFERFELIGKKINEIISEIVDILNNIDDDVKLNEGEAKIFYLYLIHDLDNILEQEKERFRNIYSEE